MRRLIDLEKQVWEDPEIEGGEYTYHPELIHTEVSCQMPDPQIKLRFRKTLRDGRKATISLFLFGGQRIVERREYDNETIVTRLPTDVEKLTEHVQEVYGEITQEYTRENNILKGILCDYKSFLKEGLAKIDNPRSERDTDYGYMM